MSLLLTFSLHWCEFYGLYLNYLNSGGFTKHCPLWRCSIKVSEIISRFLDVICHKPSQEKAAVKDLVESLWIILSLTTFTVRKLAQLAVWSTFEVKTLNAPKLKSFNPSFSHFHSFHMTMHFFRQVN